MEKEIAKLASKFTCFENIEIHSIFLFSIFLFGNAVAQNYGQKETTLRILTFNILHGATTLGDFDLDKIAAVINKANPDLVAMQEVDFKTRRAKITICQPNWACEPKWHLCLALPRLTTAAHTAKEFCRRCPYLPVKI